MTIFGLVRAIQLPSQSTQTELNKIHKEHKSKSQNSTQQIHTTSVGLAI